MHCWVHEVMVVIRNNEWPLSECIDVLCVLANILGPCMLTGISKLTALLSDRQTRFHLFIISKESVFLAFQISSLENISSMSNPRHPISAAYLTTYRRQELMNCHRYIWLHTQDRLRYDFHRCMYIFDHRTSTINCNGQVYRFSEHYLVLNCCLSSQYGETWVMEDVLCCVVDHEVAAY